MQKTGRYRYVEGEFVIRYPDLPRNGPQPDGDTVAFKPRNPEDIRAMPRQGGRPAEFNKRGITKIRFLDVDCLETHFQGAHQNLQYANAARDFVLSSLGFRNVKFCGDLPNNVESASADSMPGFILAVGTDTNGRVLADVYPHSAKPQCIHGHKTGEQLHVAPRDLDLSVNLGLAERGLTYAELYTTTPRENAKHVAAATRKARKEKVGMWPAEAANTAKEAVINGLPDIEEMVLFPKLFRRLAAFFSEGNASLGDFDAWLRQDPTNRDDRLMLPDGELGNMHDLVELHGTQLKLKYDPEDLIILPDNA